MIQAYNNSFIQAYGAYVPTRRISAVEIGKQQAKDGAGIGARLGVTHKAKAEYDEDSLTLAWEAANNAMSKLSSVNIGSVYVGSESHPYAVKSTAGILASILGLDKEIMAADLEHACKAGTAALQLVAAQVESGLIQQGLAIGADVSQAAPGDALEYTAGAGAAAFIVGPNKGKVKIHASMTLTTDTPDFWRRDYQKFPKHAHRFTGEPGYFGHILEAAKTFMDALKKTPKDFDYVVFHMPNGKFPRKVADMLGFTAEQLELGLVVGRIGNPYSASSLIGLCQVLDQAQLGQEILVVSYGSGSGSDCFWMETT